MAAMTIAVHKTDFISVNMAELVKADLEWEVRFEVLEWVPVNTLFTFHGWVSQTNYQLKVCETGTLCGAPFHTSSKQMPGVYIITSI